MWNKNGTYNFRKELLDIAEKFCDEYEERRGYRYPTERERALVRYHALCVLMDDLEMVLSDLENDPIYEGISPRVLYELEKQGEEFHKILDLLEGEKGHGNYMCGNCRYWHCNDILITNDTTGECKKMSIGKRFDSKPCKYMNRTKQ